MSFYSRGAPGQIESLMKSRSNRIMIDAEETPAAIREKLILGAEL